MRGADLPGQAERRHRLLEGAGEANEIVLRPVVGFEGHSQQLRRELESLADERAMLTRQTPEWMVEHLVFVAIPVGHGLAIENLREHPLASQRGGRHALGHLLVAHVTEQLPERQVEVLDLARDSDSGERGLEQAKREARAIAASERHRDERNSHDGEDITGCDWACGLWKLASDLAGLAALRSTLVPSSFAISSAPEFVCDQLRSRVRLRSAPLPSSFAISSAPEFVCDQLRSRRDIAHGGKIGPAGSQTRHTTDRCHALHHRSWWNILGTGALRTFFRLGDSITPVAELARPGPIFPPLCARLS
jgi:hypothetical protein